MQPNFNVLISYLDKKYAVKDVIEGVEYEFRVSAINTCGPGEPSGPSACAIARDPKGKTCSTNL